MLQDLEFNMRDAFRVGVSKEELKAILDDGESKSVVLLASRVMLLAG